MEDTTRLEEMMRILIRVTGRAAVPEEELRQIVLARGSSSQLKAYNLCDGSLSQAEVAKKAGLDQGNFSRTVKRWVEQGVLFRLGAGKEATLLHVYPLRT